jgi:hypothetical protein
VDKPVIIGDDAAESLIPAHHFCELYKVLALDALLLELEYPGEIIIDGKKIDLK